VNVENAVSRVSAVCGARQPRSARYPRKPADDADGADANAAPKGVAQITSHADATAWRCRATAGRLWAGNFSALEPAASECDGPPASVIRRTGLTHRLMSASAINRRGNCPYSRSELRKASFRAAHPDQAAARTVPLYWPQASIQKCRPTLHFSVRTDPGPEPISLFGTRSFCNFKRIADHGARLVDTSASHGLRNAASRGEDASAAPRSRWGAPSRRWL
jgi:hypothetical protein